MIFKKTKYKNFVNKLELLNKYSIIKRLPSDLGIKNNRMFAYCEYTTKELAESAIRNLNGTELKKRIVKVAFRKMRESNDIKNIDNFFLKLNKK